MLIKRVTCELPNHACACFMRVRLIIQYSVRCIQNCMLIAHFYNIAGFPRFSGHGVSSIIYTVIMPLTSSAMAIDMLFLSPGGYLCPTPSRVVAG